MNNTNPTWWPSSVGLRLLLIIGLIAIVGVLVFLGVKLWKKLRSTVKPQSYDPSQAKAAILDNLRKTKYKELAPYWAAVAAHETGNFTSSLFKRANNPWGMKQPTKRPTTSQGASNGYASYVNLNSAVDDIVNYMDYFGYPTQFESVDDFVNFMKSKGYFEDTVENYLRGVKSKMTAA